MQEGTTLVPSPARRAVRRLAAVGVVLLIFSVLPLETTVRRYLFAESIQFCLFAMAIPALLVLAVTWRPRRGLLPFGGALGVAGVFIGLCVLWRLPPVLDALVRHPILQLPEFVTLLLTGTALWLHLAAAPSSAPGLGGPRRAALAALAMWSVWVIAYVLGFANHAVVHAYDLSGTLGTVADQEITSALIWTVSAVCFVPVIYVSILGWLRDTSALGGGPAEETPTARGVAQVRGWGRASRSR